MKLLTRYNRINITLMGCIFVLASIAFYFALSTILIREVDESLEVTQEKIEEYVKANDSLPNDIADRSDDLLIEVTPVNEQQVFRKKQKTIELFNRYEHEHEKYRQARFCIKAQNSYYAIAIAKPLEGTKRLLQNIAAITIFTLLLIAIAITLANRIIFQKLWHPFYAALEQLKSYKIGSATPFTLPATNTDEFRIMNDAMEHAMNKAGNDFLTLKEFTENASHEMQTPLAIIRSKLDLLAQESDFSEKQSELLQSTQTNISRLAKLNKSLLLLAKIENQQFHHVVAIHLDEKLKDKMNLFKEIWQNNNVTVTAAFSPAVIHMDTNLCDILLNNLFSNAINHNYPGGSITFTLSQGFLSITNTSYAPEANRQQLFKRFYKGQANSTHHGLGLSIVKEICDLSHIGIDYSFKENQHTFTIHWTLPITK